jgi:hypothetical protein
MLGYPPLATVSHCLSSFCTQSVEIGVINITAPV